MSPPRRRMRPRNLEQFRGGIASSIILSIITLGIYSLFWQNRLIKAVNAFINEDKYHFWGWFFISLITCGLYNVYYSYVLAKEIVELEEREGMTLSKDLPLLSLLLTLFGLYLVTAALQQRGINDLIDKVKQRPRST